MFTPARNDLGKSDKTRLDIPYGPLGVAFYATLSTLPAKTRKKENIRITFDASLASVAFRTLFEKSTIIESEFYNYGSRADRSLGDRARLDRHTAGPLGVRFYASLSSTPSKTIHKVASPNIWFDASLSVTLKAKHYAPSEPRESLVFETSARFDRAFLDHSRLDRASDLPLGVRYHASLSSVSEGRHKIGLSSNIDAKFGSFSKQILYQQFEPRDTNSFDSTARLDRALLDLARIDQYRRIPNVKVEFIANLSSITETMRFASSGVEYNAGLSTSAEARSILNIGAEYNAVLSCFAHAGIQKMVGVEYYASLASNPSRTKQVIGIGANYESRASASVKTRNIIGLRTDYKAVLSGRFVSKYIRKSGVNFSAVLSAVKISAYGHSFIEFDVVLEPGNALVIDSVRFAALLNNKNVLDKMSGDFLFLVPGENTVRYRDRSTGREAQVKIAYEERYA